MGVCSWRAGAFVSVLMLGGLTGLYAQTCSTVSNTTTCTAANGTVAVGGGLAESTPYPLSLTMPALSGSIQKITVTVNNLTSTSGFSGGDFELVLVSPHGEQLELLSQYCNDGTDISNISLTFDDTASAKVNGGVGSNNCTGVVSGTFHTTAASAFTSNIDTVPGLTLTSAGVAQPKGTGTLISNFTQNPQGAWKLYVAMNTGGFDTGTLGGGSSPAWSLAITMNVTNQATTTAVSQSAGVNPSFTSDALTFAATVTPNPGAGTVQFLDNGSGIAGCSAQPVNGSGQAACSTTGLAEGAHNITAAFSGATGFGSSTSNALFHTVNNHSSVSGSGLSQSFCNNGAISVGSTGTANAPAPAGPYASEIFVNGMLGSLDNVTISLNNFTSPDPQTQGLLLVGPNGKTLDFFSYVGGSTSMSTRSLTIDDHGASGLLQSLVTPTAGGSYQPTSLTAGNATSYCTQSSVVSNTCNGVLVSEAPPDTFTSAANHGTGTLLGQFGGISPNGTWQLYLVNRGGGAGTTSLGGWCLNFTDTTGDPTTTALASDTNPSFTAAPNNLVTFTATVTDSVTSSTQIGSGTVLFTDNGSTIAGCSAVAVTAIVGGGGRAACATSSLTEGSHNIVASYSGSSGFGTSNGSLSQTVNTHTTTSVNGSVYTFCNPGGINIPQGQPSNALRGPSQPFPSNIFVTGLPGTLNSVSANLNSFSFSRPDQLQSLLVGPAGTTAQSIDFLSQLSTINPFGPISFTMSDGGASLAGAPTNGGTFKPFSGAANNVYSSPAPGGPYQYAAPAGTWTFTNVFGTGAGSTFNAAGTWRLYLESTTNGATGSLSSWCLNFNQNLPDLAIQNGMTHSPANFKRGSTGSFTITVSNPTGPGPSGGTLTISDTLPTGLTFTGGSGSGWACAAAGQVVTCTNPNSIAAGSSSAVTINVSVGNTTPDSISNSATLTGGGDSNNANNTATSGSITVAGTNLTVNKTHNDPFTPAQTGANYTITVHNSGASGTDSGPGATAGAVTVTDSLPNIFTPTAFGGTGWTCQSLPTLSCTLNSSLAVNATATLTLTVNVSGGASGSVINTAILSAPADQIGTDPVSHDDATNIIGPPAITSPANNTSGTSTTLTVAGTAIPNAAITIFDGPNQAGTATADGAGNFSTNISLIVGVHTLTARQTFSASTSGPSSPVTYTVNPAPPAITAPANNTSTTNTTVTVGGTATGNASVTIFDGATQIGSATADGAGNWTGPITFAIGVHSLTARQTVNGATSTPSSAVSLTITPGAPSISAPANNTSTTNTSVTVSGTAAANASVSVFDGANPVTTLTADGAGNWSGPITFSVGVHSLTARQTVNGATSAASTAVSLTIAPLPPSITSPANNSTTASTSVTVSGTANANASISVFDGANLAGTLTADGAGNWTGPITFTVGGHTLTATQTVSGATSAPSAGVNVTVAPGAPSITAPLNNFTTTNTSVTVSGTATANASVSILDGASQVGTATADAGGNFSASIALSIGTHSLTAKQTVNGVTSVAGNTVNGTVAPTAPSITAPQNNFSTTNTTVTVSGSANPNASVSITDGASLVGNTTADGAGNFSVSIALSIGTHSLAAKQTVNGIQSAPGNTVNGVVAPPAPAITSPASGFTTTNNNVTVGGTAMPNAAISLFDAANPAGSATADGSGNWSTTIVLGLGGHTLTAKQTVNTVASAASNSVGITVNSKLTPTITWSNPADIAFGTPLSSVQLNATASVPGTFVYTPAIGTVLPAGNGQTLSVQFTPTDTANYNNASASVLINVTQGSGPASILVSRTLSRDVNNDVLIQLTVANTGGSPATNVMLTSAKIGTAVTTTPLPQSLGTIPAGGSQAVTLRFTAASVGAPGTAAILSFAGTYSGTNFGGSVRITLP